MRNENGGSVDVCVAYAAIKQKGALTESILSDLQDQLSRFAGQAVIAKAARLVAKVRLIAASESSH
jgi:hypothetical protein